MKIALGTWVALSLIAGAAAPVRAAVNVERTGSENPMVEIARSTMYGGLTGLLLGYAVALADKGGDDGDIVRWGFVGGTFFGFGYGLYHVTSRPRPAALLDFDRGRLELHPPALVLDPERGMRVALVAARF